MVRVDSEWGGGIFWKLAQSRVCTSAVWFARLRAELVQLIEQDGTDRGGDRERIDREQPCWSDWPERTHTTTGNACTGNARHPGGKTFAQGAKFGSGLSSGSGLSFGSGALRCADWPGARKIGVPPRGLAECMEVQRRTQSSSSVRRRTGWELAAD